MSLKQFVAVIWLLVAVGGLMTGDVEAHAGGKMQIASEDAGPFKLTVWTSPDPAQTGEIHVATAVASAETALPILDAEVFIQLKPLDGQFETLTAQATTEESTNQFLYEAIFEVEEAGSYEVSVRVIGADGGEGEGAFGLVVEEAPPLVLGLAALVLLSIVTGGAVWFYLRSSQSKPEAGNGR